MNRSLIIRILTFGTILILAIFAGVYAYQNPENIEGASRSTISALSIIFGLSTAVSSMLLSRSTKGSSSSNDPHLAATQKEHAHKDDIRTLYRQKGLHLITLTSIIIGIIYLVALEDSPNTLVTKVLAFLFSCGTTISLLSTMFLPNLLTSLVKRNAYLQRQ